MNNHSIVLSIHIILHLKFNVFNVISYKKVVTFQGHRQEFLEGGSSMDVFVENLCASPEPHLNENNAYTNCTLGQKVSVVV